MSNDTQRYIVNPGPKEVATGLAAACSSDHRIVTETILSILKRGGNAIDAAIAGCIVQAAVEPYLTNHCGTVTCLYYEAATGKLHQLDSSGTFPSGLAPFKPIPRMASGLAQVPPSACIPGFMPGLKAMHSRFGTKPWAELCEDAIAWASDGHPVSSYELASYATTQDFLTYFPDGRRFFMPKGHLTPVGERFGSHEMAETLRCVAKDGPDHMIVGEWADKFISEANAMGWPITKRHMTETPPRWIEPLRFRHGAYEIVSLAPPQRQGVYCALVLGILSQLDYRSMQPGSADALYYMAQALRWAEKETGHLNDPEIYDVPTDVWLDPAYHAYAARILSNSRPKVDLSDHVGLTQTSVMGSIMAGFVTPGEPSGTNSHQATPTGSCELSIVDAQGNWVQMMNTMQSGGIPGKVIAGIPMIGSHSSFGRLDSVIDTRLVPGARMRAVIGNTFILDGGVPVMSLGTPGNVFCTVPQVLANLLDFGMEPYAAIDAPRMLPLGDDCTLVMEDRLAPEALSGLRRLGIRVKVTPAYDHHMGSYQMCWRDGPAATLNTCADPRRCGVADGIRA